MINQHPITPPRELLDKWNNLSLSTQEIFVIVAQWGADQELKACCKWMKREGHEHEHAELLAARRFKPPSLKEQALDQLDHILTHDNEGRTVGVDVSIIRRALEALPE